MSKLSFLSCAALSWCLVSCGSPEAAQNEAATAPAAATAATAAPATTAGAPDMSSWQPTDLSKVVPTIPVTLNLPAGVPMEKNPNGGVDIHLNDKQLLTVSNQAITSVQEGLASDDDFYLKHELYQNAKKLVTDPNGFVYTRQMKTEANGTTYEPEAHFVYYLTGKDGSFYQIAEDRSMEALSGKGSDYPAEQAQTLFALVKKSAKVN